MEKLKIYNSLTRKKENFEPINPPYVGMYVCGPTVYGDPHLGHARAAVTFDIVFRYLKYLGYKVRYVSNITDVGHLENDSDEGEDKIAKRARLEQLEPMEIANYYTRRYNEAIKRMNVLPPSIQPLASGHIPEQIQMVEKILENGYAYESNGSVYFDLEKYSKQHNYGKLSGKKLEDLIAESRELQGTSEKKHPFDFALWKKADPKHIMRWKTRWSDGFPGWHLECSVMSTKYLGEQFDIHGGGLDLQFPHHESEIAQSVAANGKEPVKYWMHNNLVTINGQKMSKSLGNFITLYELFDGEKPADGRKLPLDRTFSPMTVRFFILQAHYRSPLDFSQKALEAAEKGIKRLFNGLKNLDKIIPSDTSDFNVNEFEEKVFNALNDDFNTPVVIAELFEGIKFINLAKEGKQKINSEDLEKLKKIYNTVVFNILGLNYEEEGSSEIVNKLVDLILTIRLEAKKKKDFQTADKIRDNLKNLRIIVRDLKDGFEWEFE